MRRPEHTIVVLEEVSKLVVDIEGRGMAYQLEHDASFLSTTDLNVKENARPA